VNLNGATDVSGMTLPTGALPAGIMPVQKSLFIDLLDSDFGLQNHDDRAIAEKIEGLAWGPDLPDGRHLLYVISDNDLVPSLPTQIFAFGHRRGDACGALAYEPQFLPGPLYPPGEVKKQIGK
jgi:Esterase-like activity of phytase